MLCIVIQVIKRNLSAHRITFLYNTTTAKTLKRKINFPLSRACTLSANMQYIRVCKQCILYIDMRAFLFLLWKIYAIFTLLRFFLHRSLPGGRVCNVYIILYLQFILKTTTKNICFIYSMHPGQERLQIVLKSDPRKSSYHIIVYSTKKRETGTDIFCYIILHNTQQQV